jgi:hypothetical protein
MAEYKVDSGSKSAQVVMKGVWGRGGYRTLGLCYFIDEKEKCIPPYI